MLPWRNLFRCERRTKNCTSDCKTAIVINKKKPRVTLVNPGLCLHHPGFCAFRAFFCAKESEWSVWRWHTAWFFVQEKKNDTEQTTKAKWQTAWNHTNCGLLKQPKQHLIWWYVESYLRNCTKLMQAMPTLDHRHWSTWSLTASGFKILDLENFNWKPKNLTFNKMFIPVWSSFRSH